MSVCLFLSLSPSSERCGCLRRLIVLPQPQQPPFPGCPLHAGPTTNEHPSAPPCHNRRHDQLARQEEAGHCLRLAVTRAGIPAAQRARRSGVTAGERSREDGSRKTSKRRGARTRGTPVRTAARHRLLAPSSSRRSFYDGWQACPPCALSFALRFNRSTPLAAPSLPGGRVVREHRKGHAACAVAARE